MSRPMIRSAMVLAAALATTLSPRAGHARPSWDYSKTNCHVDPSG